MAADPADDDRPRRPPKYTEQEYDNCFKFITSNWSRAAMLKMAKDLAIFLPIVVLRGLPAHTRKTGCFLARLGTALYPCTPDGVEYGVCLEWIGTGKSRAVYAYPGEETVFKLEMMPGPCNSLEVDLHRRLRLPFLPRVYMEGIAQVELQRTWVQSTALHYIRVERLEGWSVFAGEYVAVELVWAVIHMISNACCHGILPRDVWPEINLGRRPSSKTLVVLDAGDWVPQNDFTPITSFPNAGQLKGFWRYAKKAVPDEVASLQTLLQNEWRDTRRILQRTRELLQNGSGGIELLPPPEP
jgi:hypothetical protein